MTNNNSWLHNKLDMKYLPFVKNALYFPIVISNFCEIKIPSQISEAS